MLLVLTKWKVCQRVQVKLLPCDALTLKEILDISYCAQSRWVLTWWRCDWSSYNWSCPSIIAPRKDVLELTLNGSTTEWIKGEAVWSSHIYCKNNMGWCLTYEAAHKSNIKWVWPKRKLLPHLLKQAKLTYFEIKEWMTFRYSWRTFHLFDELPLNGC